MNKIKYEFINFVREHIDKFDDVGCGMYNLWIDGNLFQIFPYEKDDLYGHIYYTTYTYDEKGYGLEDNIYKLEDLNRVEQESLLKQVKEEVENN